MQKYLIKLTSTRSTNLFKKLIVWTKNFFLRIQEDGFINTVHFTYLFILPIVIKKIFPNPHLYAGQVHFIKGLSKKNPKAIAKVQKLISIPLHKKHNIAGYYTCLHGQEKSFENEKTALIAHNDPEQVIDPYVEYLCKHLKSLGFNIILISAQAIKNNEVLDCWQEWADAIIYRTCTGCDFTSWKAALHCFPSIYKSKELLLTNDSYYGPFGSFRPVHERMEGIECDFWGLMYSEHTMPHLKTSYLVLKNNILQDTSFINFVDAIPLFYDKQLSRNIELNLSIYFSMQGFQGGAYAQSPHKLVNIVDTLFVYYSNYFDYGIKIIFKNHIYKEKDFLYFFNLNKIKSNQDCFEVAHNHILRLGSLPNKKFSYANQDYVGHTVREYENFPESVLALYEKVNLSQYTNISTKNQTTIAIALHCFYPDTLDSIIPYLLFFPAHVHLYVTTDTEEKKKYIVKKLQNTAFEYIDVRICPNQGWDMAPFFIGLKDVLLKYELILKLHVKKSTHMDAALAHAWREVLYGSLMRSSEHVSNIIKSFEHNPKLGVIAPTSYPPFSLPLQRGNKKNIHNILQRQDINLPPDAAIDFPVGGMFWCRSKILHPWLKLNLSYDDFNTTNIKQRDGTLAHTLERVIFWGCGLEGMIWSRVSVENKP